MQKVLKMVGGFALGAVVLVGIFALGIWQQSLSKRDDGLAPVVVIPSITPAVIVSTNTPEMVATEELVDLARWEAIISDTIRGATSVNLVSVRIADGRAIGGERAVIIAFSAPIAEQAAAVGSVWAASGAAIRQFSMDVDSLTVIYGVSESSGSNIVVLQVADLLSYLNAEITIDELLARAR